MDRTSIGIRGTPSQGAWIHHNWFHNPKGSMAMFAFAGIIHSDKLMLALRWTGELLGIGNVHAYRNVFGEERRLVEGPFFDESVRIETEKSLRGLSPPELVEAVRIQRDHAGGPPTGATGQAPLEEQSPEQLVSIIMQGLERAAGEGDQ